MMNSAWILRRQTLIDKFCAMPWLLFSTFVGITTFGVLVLLSATNGDIAQQSLLPVRLGHVILAFAIALPMAFVPLRIWYHVAIPLYGASLVLLALVEVFGTEAGGAARWLQIGPVRLQPSELMKFSLILALAGIYHAPLKRSGRLQKRLHLKALIVTALPVALIARQPDLGTAAMIAALGGSVVLMAGLSARIIVAAAVILAVATPAIYTFGLRDYQKQRVLTFLDPARDPLGAGYQLQQAKIAIGSGGLGGRGYMQGTQSQLEYIPEQHTDFIFTLVAEEFGFVGSMALILAWLLAVVMGLAIAARSHSPFGALIAAGAAILPGLHVVLNIAMVTGLAPVVGMPLPLMSHGGTATLTVLAALGLMMSAKVHQREIPTSWSQKI